MKLRKVIRHTVTIFSVLLIFNFTTETASAEVVSYPNGLYCSDETGSCWINESEAWSAVGGIVRDGWIESLSDFFRVGSDFPSVRW